MRFLIWVVFFLFLAGCETKTEDKVADFPTHFENSNGTETATYLQVVDFYIRLAKEFPEINFQTIGETDSGHPLHIVTYNPAGDFNFKKIGAEKTVILINNGIHPGESDGIDATMMLYRDFATGKLAPPENTVLVSIPVYNIGGALNRNSVTRANQNGPLAYGFRGNAKNFDLNRDFIKADTKNAETFADIYHLVNPDIFIDTHVSNGADYQYILTHLFTQHNKLGGDLGAYLHQELMPKLEDSLAAVDWDITPYVNVYNRVPESGFSQFIDHPRYSTGYTALWNTLGMMVETHMLKPYEQRVRGTYELLLQMIRIAEGDGEKIRRLREEALTRHQKWTFYPVQWAIDTTRSSTLDFKGYEADTLTSEVTGFPRLQYDRNRPFTKPIVYQNFMKPSDSVLIPKAYIIKKGYEQIVELMERNKIQYKTLQKDTILLVESYRIKDYQTMANAYEGHYPHYGTKVSKQMKKMSFSEGDYLVHTDQPGIRYILETLEPSAVDSFFNWNFFDPILQQKEGFSPYVFEDVAAKMLSNDPGLRDSFLQKKADDPVFAANWYAQLEWFFKQSPHYESAHLQYPIYRLPKD
ncbi:M14 family metallopeptidase [Flavobacteriaceae bacterium TP-CH-4]|uniref:M14 family metallopeptidase n=1 Tax=Pelagihabitans pacificus TaxID=2696054 RepID=A0A967AUR6_9FLAO|nr:M14 family metallopeptidase [Pelagihabitans pacificus]NHF60756.1 M14 family metallopeptidase [Pelagihabitans pacificus]